ncbi:MAG: glycosyltransferase family 4 protein [Bacteroidales bacterium]|nr:glycosyltransferase family 4 protein [Bacteroidales bacterium]
MRIAVNTRLLLKDKLEGIGWFSYESLKRICTQHPEHEFFFIFDRKWSNDFIFSDNITPISVPPQARHPLLYYVWFEHSIPTVLRKIQPDLFFSPDGYLSLRTKVKSVNVFHDLSFEHYPMDVPTVERFYYRRYFPKFAKKAERIATVSEYSKQDIVKTYGVNPDKIDVVYNGSNPLYKPVSESVKQETLQKYSACKPYFVFVGALHPRKNLVNLFKAFDIFRKENTENINLLIVGAKMWWTKAIEQAYNEMVFKNDVVFTGRLNTEELNKVLGSALALTYVSYFEGFGIPIIEAFYCDTPVITSNITSMPEAAGDAALLVNPFSPNSIAEAMHDVVSNKELRQDLISKGRLRRQHFSWQQTADRLWGTIEKVL